MAENTHKNLETAAKTGKKSVHAEREERILAFWKEKGIFEKSLIKKSPKGEFIFYEGPPTANGRPGIHHLEARAFKDAIPRYKTMRGYHVRRKGGWDTHGLPVELQVEKSLGLKSKKEIETYGVAAFNQKCQESVWTYVHEFENFTDRMGYWVDLKNPYITYKPQYIESLWNIVKKVEDDKLLYKDYKVVPWCPRCGTALSSHELAQGYEEVKDNAVTIKFKIKNEKSNSKNTDKNLKSPDTYLLAWTTTPWTLPGNVGLAVNEKINYLKVRFFRTPQGDLLYEPNSTISRADCMSEEIVIAKERLENYTIRKSGSLSLEEAKMLPHTPSERFEYAHEIISEIKGSDLISLEYEPLYPFLKDNISGPEKEKVKNAYKVYAADFVTTEDGTGIVHTAVMYGQDDFVLGNEVGLPKYHLVNEDGTFKKETGFLAGLFVKDQNTDVALIKDLAAKNLLFAKEKYAHSYPHCWRCHTPLIYFARDSWYIRMSDLRKKLVKENEGINWEPAHLKEGRFGEWLSEVKDWAISRERYWGTPLPVWVCDVCKKRKVVGSIAEVSARPRNAYFMLRHGQADNNVQEILSNDPEASHHLTEKGKRQVTAAADLLKKKKIDLVFISPFVRTRETAEILKNKLGWTDEQIVVAPEIRELNSGAYANRSVADFSRDYPFLERFETCPLGGETYADIKKRMGDFLYGLDQKYQGKNILIISHETALYLLQAAASGLDRAQSLVLRGDRDYIANAEVRELQFSVMPHNPEYELDLHRPFIDAVKLACSCGGNMNRVKEVMDVWFDSGAMPFAQDHYPFENKKFVEKQGYPADFIAEAIDQTRGWFYTLHAVGTLMGWGKAYKNVICLGHILDPEGKKMSKSVGNVVDPFEMMNVYGADALRLWMYSVNQPGDSKNFDQKTVDDLVKKVFNLAGNVLAFYGMYENSNLPTSLLASSELTNVLDRWIMARLNELVGTVTEGLDGYKFFEPTRAIRDFIADLSQWYLQSSRDRFKGDEAIKAEAMATLRFVLLTLSKVMAPLAPFFAEHIYQGVRGSLESVHLEQWPNAGKIDRGILAEMETARKIVEAGLALRSCKKLAIRQPLSELQYQMTAAQKSSVSAEMHSLIAAKLNVEKVVASEVNQIPMSEIKEENEWLYSETGGIRLGLNTHLTPELRDKGDIRELLRAIQDLRKTKGLKVSDRATLVVRAENESRAFFEQHQAEIVKATSMANVTFEAPNGESLAIGSRTFGLDIVHN
jgi:isoleucyl-tRNA synthetase